MEHEALIRMVVFLGLFSLFAALEAWAPRRERSQTRTARWSTNWAIIIVDTLTLRALAIGLPLLAVGAAYDAGENGWGLFNIIDLPLWVEILAAILILDFAIWLQHSAIQLPDFGGV